jgi:hypothetical protein
MGEILISGKTIADLWHDNCRHATYTDVIGVQPRFWPHQNPGSICVSTECNYLCGCSMLIIYAFWPWSPSPYQNWLLISIRRIYSPERNINSTRLPNGTLPHVPTSKSNSTGSVRIIHTSCTIAHCLSADPKDITHELGAILHMDGQITGDSKTLNNSITKNKSNGQEEIRPGPTLSTVCDQPRTIPFISIYRYV